MKPYSKQLEKEVRNLSCQSSMAEIERVIAKVNKFDKKKE